MRRPLIKALLFLTCLSVVVSNCSSPLDPSSIGQPAPPAIITITDTVIDTLILNGTDTLIDTLIQTEVDTVFVVDTLIDTVFVEITDSTAFDESCGKIERCMERLVWQFTNSPGRYAVQLTAEKCDKLYPKELIAIVNGVEYPWRPGRSNILTIEQELSADALVSVERPTWIGWGDAVRVCITLTRLD